MIRTDAPTLARGWLSVATASPTNDPDTVLHRTVAIEEHTTGCRLVATDRFVLFTTWITDLGHDGPEPGILATPERTVVVADLGLRARSLMKHALAYVKKEDPDGVEPPGTWETRIEFDHLTPATVGVDPTLEGLGDVPAVKLVMPQVEAVYLPVVPTPFPSWREAWTAGDSAAQIGQARFDPARLAVALAPRTWCDGPVVWDFGADSAAGVDYPESDPHVQGLVMPTKVVSPSFADPDV